MRVLGYSLETNWPVGAIKHSPQSVVEVKNEWSYASSPVYFFMAWTRKTLPLTSTWQAQAHCLVGEGARRDYDINIHIKLNSGFEHQWSLETRTACLTDR